MNSVTKEQQALYQNAKFVIFVKKSLKINMLRIKNIAKLGTIVIMQSNIEVLHIACVI